MRKIKKYNQFFLERKSSSVNEEWDWAKKQLDKLKNLKGDAIYKYMAKLLPTELLNLVKSEAEKIKGSKVDLSLEEGLDLSPIFLNEDLSNKFIEYFGKINEEVDENSEEVENSKSIIEDFIDRKFPSLGAGAKKALRIASISLLLFFAGVKASAAVPSSDQMKSLIDTKAKIELSTDKHFKTEPDDDGKTVKYGDNIHAQPLPKNAEKVTDGLYKVKTVTPGDKTIKGEGERGGIKVGNLPTDIKNNPLESKFDDLNKPLKNNPNKKISDTQLMELTFLKISTKLDKLGDNPTDKDIQKVIDDVQNEIDQSSAKGDIKIYKGEVNGMTKILFDQKMNQSDTDKINDKTGEVEGKWSPGEVSKGRLGGDIKIDKTPDKIDGEYLVKIVINGYKIIGGQSQPQSNAKNYNSIADQLGKLVQKFDMSNIKSSNAKAKNDELAKSTGNMSGEYYVTADEAKALIESGWAHVPVKGVDHDKIDTVLSKATVKTDIPKFEKTDKGYVQISLTNDNVDSVNNLLKILSNAKIYSSN